MGLSLGLGVSMAWAAGPVDSKPVSPSLSGAPVQNPAQGARKVGAKSTGKLNDSGLAECLVGGVGWTTACAGTGQDAAYGRDKTTNDPSDGRAGFSFVKISSTGVALPADAPDWVCVKDKVTGLIWEVKTSDGGVRDAAYSYTNHGDGRMGDASAFVAEVNGQGLCGAKDWRLPTRQELHSIVDFGVVHHAEVHKAVQFLPTRQELHSLVDFGVVYHGPPRVDELWFPNTLASSYWTGTADASDTSQSWRVSFASSGIGLADRASSLAVRLVRGGS